MSKVFQKFSIFIHIASRHPRCFIHATWFKCVIVPFTLILNVELALNFCQSHLMWTPHNKLWCCDFQALEHQTQCRSRGEDWASGQWSAAMSRALLLLACTGSSLHPGLVPQTLWTIPTTRQTLFSLRHGSSAEDGRRVRRRLGGRILTVRLDIRVQNELRSPWRSPGALWAGGRPLRCVLRSSRMKWNRTVSKPHNNKRVVVSPHPAAALYAGATGGSRPRSCQLSLRCRVTWEWTMNIRQEQYV